jgi:hypothetical protein
VLLFNSPVKIDLTRPGHGCTLLRVAIANLREASSANKRLTTALPTKPVAPVIKITLYSLHKYGGLRIHAAALLISPSATSVDIFKKIKSYT